MSQRIRLIIFFLLTCASVWARDSIQTKQPQFVSFSVSGGSFLPTSYIDPQGFSRSPGYSAVMLKYGFSARGDRWQDAVYGMPYKGIGVYLPCVSGDKYDLGNPFSVFLFQGGLLKQFSSRWSLHYEINLGVSFNWQHYDAEERPWLKAVGASANIHLGGNAYLKRQLSRHFDLHVGVGLNHFSNGALRTPNHGLNQVAAFVELAYNINPIEEKKKLTEEAKLSPPVEKKAVHDLSLMVTTRTLKVDTLDTGLRSKYPQERFKVAGLNYSCLFPVSRRVMLGPSIEAVYDESVRAEFWGWRDTETKQYYETVKKGKFSERFSVGLSLKGELSMPGYSIFANLGYDVWHKDKIDPRLYQIYGLKVYLYKDLYGTFGVRSTNLTRSRYLYLNVGYTFK